MRVCHQLNGNASIFRLFAIPKYLSMRYHSVLPPPFLLFIILLCLSYEPLPAQELLQKLGGISTDYTILLENDTLQVLDQYIIKRTHAKRSADNSYSYESLHFEFSSIGQELYASAGDSWGKSHTIFFLDAAGQSLGFFRQDLIGLRRLDDEEADRLRCFSLDLEGIPLTNLQHCSTIKLVPR